MSFFGNCRNTTVSQSLVAPLKDTQLWGDSQTGHKTPCPTPRLLCQPGRVTGQSLTMSAHLLGSHKVKTSLLAMLAERKHLANVNRLALGTWPTSISFRRSFTFYLPANAEGRKWLCLPSKIWPMLAMFMVVICCTICPWHLQLTQAKPEVVEALAILEHNGNAKS